MVGPLELVVAVGAKIVPEPAEEILRHAGLDLEPEEKAGPELVKLVPVVLEVENVLGLGGQALVRFVDLLELFTRRLLVSDVLVCQKVGREGATGRS